jgi:hypothetical protein
VRGSLSDTGCWRVSWTWVLIVVVMRMGDGLGL